MCEKEDDEDESVEKGIEGGIVVEASGKAVVKLEVKGIEAEVVIGTRTGALVEIEEGAIILPANVDLEAKAAGLKTKPEEDKEEDELEDNEGAIVAGLKEKPLEEMLILLGIEEGEVDNEPFGNCADIELAKFLRGWYEVAQEGTWGLLDCSANQFLVPSDNISSFIP